MIELFPTCFFVCHLTLRCNYDCSYCIQKHDTGNKDIFNTYEEKDVDYWINGIKRFTGSNLYLSGGEITLLGEEYIAELVNNIDSFSRITIGTNLEYDIDKLLLLLKPKTTIEFGVSYQYEFTTKEIFKNKLDKIRKYNYHIVATMLSINSQWNQDKNYFSKKMIFSSEDEELSDEELSAFIIKKLDEKFVVEPGATEDKNTFVSRCIEIEVGKGHPQQQAIAICESKWANKK